jgi:carbonic anhydrase
MGHPARRVDPAFVGEFEEGFERLERRFALQCVVDWATDPQRRSCVKKRFALVIVSFVLWAACCASMSAQTPAATGPPDFSYSGDTGPGLWPVIHNDEYPNCAPLPANRQSPIDINSVVEDPRLGPLDLKLVEAPFILTNTGYTIQANPQFGSSLTIDGHEYPLAQFHFHTLSEHTVGGIRGAMELHIVFGSSTADLAVIGVLYRIGRPNPFLQQLIDTGLPAMLASAHVTVPHLDIQKALTDTSQYFTYDGSLTTPGCDPTVKWLVLKQWSEVSPEQYEAFRKILGNDFRPIQKQNQRVVRATVRRGFFGEGAAPTAP